MLDAHDTNRPLGSGLGNLDKKWGTQEAKGHGQGDLLDTDLHQGLPRLVLPDPLRSSSLDHTFHLPLPRRWPPGPEPTCFKITFKEVSFFFPLSGSCPHLLHGLALGPARHSWTPRASGSG